MLYLISIAVICSSWIFPFANEPIASAEQQIFSACMLSLVVCLCALKMRLSWAKSIFFVLFCFVFTLTIKDERIWVLMGAVLLANLAWLMGTNTSNLATRNRNLYIVLTGTMLGAAVNALYGLLQYLGLAGQLWPWVPESLLRGVAYGVFRQSNLFATLLCCGIACTVYLVQCKKITVAMAWLIVIVLHMGVAASGSRIAVMQALAFAIVGFMWRSQQQLSITRLLVGQLGVLVFASVMLPYVACLHGFEPRSLAQRLSHMPQDSRLAVWADALQLILAKPWSGLGWGEFAYGHYMLASPSRFNRDSILDNAHNMPLHLAAELGLPVTLVLCGLFAYVVWRARPWLAGKRNLQPYWLIILSLTLHSMVEFPLWYAGFLFLFAMALAAVSSTGVVQSDIGHPELLPPRHWSLWPSKFLAIAMIAFCCVAWVQYQKIVAIYATPVKRVEQRAAAIERAQSAWLFKGQVKYAEFGQMNIDKDPTATVREKAERLLHFSAEPRVVQGLLYVLWRQNDWKELQLHAHRYCIAFPLGYARWAQANAQLPVVVLVRTWEDGCHLPSEAYKLLDPSS